MDSVIEQLREELKQCEDYHKKYGNMGNQIYAYKRALEIVESGINAKNDKCNT